MAANRRSRVFVVQLSGDAVPGRGHLVGRVEHVDSGRSTRFGSGEEMIEFFASLIREIEASGATHDSDNSAGNH